MAIIMIYYPLGDPPKGYITSCQIYLKHNFPERGFSLETFR